MGYLGKRALRAEWFGDVAESAKQSQLPRSEQGHRQAALAAATRTVTSDGAEQSQFQADTSWRTKPIGAEASSFKREVSSSASAPAGDGSDEQSQLPADALCGTKPIGTEASSFKCEVSSSTPSPGGDPSRGRLGYMPADPSCQTKPNLERMGYLGKRTLRAERFGDVAESAKQSQLAISEHDHRQASLDAATQTLASDSVKRTQFPADASWRTKPIGAGASSFKCEVSSSASAPAGDDSDEQSQLLADALCQTKPIWR
jgi:hypothetical protein